MTAFEKMQMRSQAKGSTIRNKMANNARNIVNRLLPNDPSYKTVEILGKGFVNLRLNGYKLVDARTTPQMDIQASLDEDITFTLGDVLVYDGGYWICVQSSNNHGIERSGKVEECNYYLRWQNPKTLEVHGRWCSLRDPSSMALDERARLIVTGSAKYTIKLPHDEETAQFFVDRRFLIDMANGEPIPYSIIKYDAVSSSYAARNEGFLNLILRESQIAADDNWDLMVANYVDPLTSKAPNTPNTLLGSCSIEFNGSPIIRAGGSPKPFRATFTNVEGKSIKLDSPIEWMLQLPPELNTGQITIVQQSGKEIRLQAASSVPIGSTFVLQMRANDANYGKFKAELTIRIGGMI